MSSTNKTANLKLNQWVLTDPFLMEDMNADNQRIDTAVGSICYVKLLDTTLSANAQQVDLDLSSIDLTKYSSIKVSGVVRLTPLNTANLVNIKINNNGAYLRGLDESSVSWHSFVGCADPHTLDNYPSNFTLDIENLPSAVDSSYLITIFSLGTTYFYNSFQVRRYIGTLPLDTNVKISSVNITTDKSTVYIKQGSRFEIYGVKR